MTSRVALVAVAVGAVPRPTTGGSSTGEVVFRFTIAGPTPPWRQVLSLGYVYPDPTSGLILPDTAMPTGD